jgi:xanthine/uracil permease
VDVSLEIAVGLVLVWFQGAGSVFKDVASNKVALSAISAVALLLFIDAGVKLYRGVNRIPSPDEFRSETS